MRLLASLERNWLSHVTGVTRLAKAGSMAEKVNPRTVTTIVNLRRFDFVAGTDGLFSPLAAAILSVPSS